MTQIISYAISLAEFHPILYYLSAVVAALLLYVLRSKRQTLYGLLEIAGGFLLVFLSQKIIGGDFSSKDFSPDFSITVRTVVNIATYLGAIFAMVRGLDNIKQGWPSFKVPFLNRPLNQPTKSENGGAR
jgi:uncharacterized membrane protein (GlpM family)